MLKFNGQYLNQSVQPFGKIFYDYCRAGLGIKYFKVAAYLKRCNVEETEGKWLNFILENVRYCPIVGIETVPQIESMDENK